MFPCRLRKSPPSLLDLAMGSVRSYLHSYLRSGGDPFSRSVHLVRQRLDDQLLPALHTRILSELVPVGDTWRYSCMEAKKGRLKCRAHRECRLVYKQ